MPHADQQNAFINTKVEHDTQERFRAADDRVMRDIWGVLQRHYPGHPWGTKCDHSQGIAQILLPTFTDWQQIIRLDDYYSDPGRRLVIKLAGEFLERYKMPRKGFDVGHYMAAQHRILPFLNMKRRPPD